MATLVALLIFAAVTITVLAVVMFAQDLRRGDEDLQRRLGLALKDLQLDWQAVFAARSPRSRMDQAFYALIEGCGTRIDAQTALALVAGLAVVGCVVPLVLLDSFTAAACGTVVGAALPLLWWNVQRALRYRAMQRVLPETLEMLADEVRSGQSLEQAAGLVAVQAPQPIREEFGYCVSQLRLGHSPVAVLQRMSRRIPIPEFKIFTTAVLVHRQTGGNLALLAQRLAGSARDRSELHGHVRAVTAGSRLSVLGLTVGTVIAMGVLASLRPEYLQSFVSHPAGPALLGIAAVLQMLGILWVWRIVRVHF